MSLTAWPRSDISSFIERIAHATRQPNSSHVEGLGNAAGGSDVRPVRSPLVDIPLMEADAAIVALGALAQGHRLALFRLLVQAGGGGMSAGALADALSVPNSSLSFHLAHLNRAGLIEQRRQGRSLVYTANYDAMNALVGYLMENCCGGADCAPAAAPKPDRISA